MADELPVPDLFPESVEPDVDELFDKFYQHYPRKVAKGAAKKAFVKLDPSEELVDEMIRAIQAQVLWRKAMVAANQFLPPWKHPATWIRAECWEDELTSIADIKAKSNDGKCDCGRDAFMSAAMSPNGKPICTRCYDKELGVPF